MEPTKEQVEKVDRVVTRGRLRGVAGLKQGLGWCVIPAADRRKLTCTKCANPPSEGWLVYVSAPKPDTAIEVRCSKHSMYREAVRINPNESQRAKERAQRKLKAEQGAVVTKQTATFLSYLPVLGFAAAMPVVREAVQQWVTAFGHDSSIKRAALLEKQLHNWLDSLPESERVLAVIGREQ